MKHKHYDKIVAKAANVELVVFFNPSFGSGSDKWEEATTTLFPAFHPDTEYFLCLPQHKDACLHYLNGGDVLVKSNLAPSWTTVTHGQLWGKGIGWMREDAKYRIKPKKEKRWIAYSTNQKRLGCLTFDSELEVRNYYIHEVDKPQFIEIEVEV